jgi:proliferating cell nuclear antigen
MNSEEQTNEPTNETILENSVEAIVVDTSKYSVHILTIQSVMIKCMVEAVKEILPDTNIEIGQDGIRILSMDPTHTTLVHMSLQSNNFESYFCRQKQIIGINMINFFKLIKTITNNDTLTLFIEKDDVNHLGIKIENEQKKYSTMYKLALMDLNDQVISVPPAKFSSVITMKATDFQKICRDMNNISDEIEIKAVAGQLILTCQGEFAHQETILGESTNGGMTFAQNNDDTEIIQGIFSLKYLTLFTKCTNLCQSIQIFLKNDYPIIVSYDVGSIGSIRFAAAPVTREITS